MKTVIEVKGLSFEFEPIPGRGVKRALDDVTFSVREGEFVVITGASGCGKSTLCRCLNGLIPHAVKGSLHGSVSVCGMETGKRQVQELSPYVSLVFQNPDNQLFSHNVESEIAFGPENLGLHPEEIKTRVDMAIEALSIGQLRGRLIDELSGGEKQRVAIASAMAMNPRVLVLDEPTSELDPAAAVRLMGILYDLNRSSGITVVLIEHRLERLIQIMTRLIVLQHGRIAFDGTPEEVFRHGLSETGIGIPPAISIRRHMAGSYKRCAREKRCAIDRGPPAISVKSLSYRYPGSALDAIADINIDIQRNEITVIMGGNGSGKTTLVKHFNGLLKPDSGAVFVGGKDIRGKTVAEISRSVGLVFQNADYQLFEETVRGELAFAPANVGLDKASIDSRINNTAIMLGLDAVGLLASPHFLSGGEKQRVAIGSIMTLEPDIVILDEPTLGLDRKNKDGLAECLYKMKSAARAVIIITHDVEFAAKHAERVILMTGGRIAACGDAIDILTDKSLLESVSLHLPQATEIALSMGLKGVLTVDDMQVTEERPCSGAS